MRLNRISLFSNSLPLNNTRFYPLMSTTTPIRMFDIAFNGCDPMFRGQYHAKQKHKDDFIDVLDRARCSGVELMMISSSSLSESAQALDLALEHDGLCSTVGCHPTRCNEFEEHNDPDQYYSDLLALATRGKKLGKVVAIGECGLDYDRIHFCSNEVQLKYFARQFELANVTGMPMFLHDRNTGGDMHMMLRRYRDQFNTGVVHSFTGTKEELNQHLDMGLYIGINGCSLKTQDNVQLLKHIPLDRLMLETDAPWCDIRPTHASFPFIQPQAAHSLVPNSSNMAYPFPEWVFDDKNKVKKPEKYFDKCMVKGRNEPCAMISVLLAVAAIREESVKEVADAVWENSNCVFGAFI